MQNYDLIERLEQAEDGAFMRFRRERPYRWVKPVSRARSKVVEIRARDVAEAYVQARVAAAVYREAKKVENAKQ